MFYLDHSFLVCRWHSTILPWSLMKINVYKGIVDRYYEAISMIIKINKHHMLINGLKTELERNISQVLNMSSYALDQRVKYIGLNIKTNDYKFVNNDVVI